MNENEKKKRSKRMGKKIERMIREGYENEKKERKKRE